MDKSWIDWADWCSKPYRAKLEDFLNFAYVNRDPSSRIYCPCRKCENRKFFEKVIVRQHLHGNGFWKKYKIWDKHGESRDGAGSLHRDEMFMGSDDYMEEDMVRLVQEAIGTANVVRPHDESGGESSNPLVGPNESTKQFLKLMKSANLPLYPGSKKHTTLSFIVRLLQAKVLNGWTDKSFKDLLDICNESMPEGVNLPNSYYQAQKLTEDLGFTYNTVDACPNSCMLFRNEDINLDQCLICKASRWKEDGCSLVSDLGPGKRKAAKQARYFPLKPRLQRLFMSSKIATLMRWHAEKRTDDGVFRHPADSLAWKDFDKKHPSFSGDIRNVRLGLASDGFNPFRTMNIVHSTWPVILVPYNLPPMMLMKQPFIYLSVLIDGPKGPGDKIDVYLQPLIEELKELWDEGIETFDASSNQMFQMHAALLWTINDFPAYANLSGWSTKGEYACPSCNSETASIWLPNGKKFSYGSSRRFLPYDHKYRKDPRSFNGLREYRRSPTTLSGVDLLTQLQSNGILTEYRREDLQTRQMMGPEKPEKDPLKKRKHNWKKKSIFFELPYWKDNLIRHNLDVMHIEKNVCDNVLGTILGVAGKSKDNISSRRDLELMGIREQYHVKRRESGSEYFDPADFEMNNDGKDKFLVALSETRMPDGSASHIARRVRLKDRSISGLKSHDNHILLQQLIPLSIRSSLPKKVVEGLIDLGKFFKVLCSKLNCAADLEEAHSRIVVTLCDLEKIFPPSFFDVMEHLPVHLVQEALIAGAVQFRWMYPIERYLLTLKEYVRNRACPEASIAKGYLMEECMNFCTQYLKDVESKFNRPLRRKNRDDHEKGNCVLSEVTRIQIHRWVLFHTRAVTPFLKEHLTAIKQQFPDADDHYVQRVHFDEFANWFKDHVITLQNTSDILLSEEIIALSSPPSPSATKVNSYTSNGYFFRVKSVDNKRSRQNSGVALQADTMSVGNKKDKNPRVDVLPYYGRLTEIIKVTYSVDIKYVLFRCDWVHPVAGIKLDPFNFTLVNFNRLLYRNDRVGDEPFILASQAQQVWYAPDPSGQGWLNVVEMESKNFSHVQTDNTEENDSSGELMDGVEMDE